jgi:hypothetical protein
MEQEQIQILKSLYQEAEAMIKDVEVNYNAFMLPPINELRYAGHHILLFMEKGIDTDFQKAKNHIERAIFDGLEINILVYLDKILTLEEKYQFAPFSSVIFNWTDLKVELNRIADRNKKIVLEEAKEGRIESYRKSIGSLKQIWSVLEAAEDDIKKLNQEKMAQSKNRTAVVFATVFAGVLTVLVGILQIIF